MAIKINLLPPGLGVAGTLGKVLKLARMLGVIGLAFFVVFALGISAFFVLSTITLRGLDSDRDSLKAQIETFQSTEQQLVLLKDRIGKIKTVLNLPEAVKNLDMVDPFISTLGPSASLGQLAIDDQKIDLSLQFSSTADTSAFIKSLSDSKVFTSVVLTSFTYNPAGGYSVGVSLKK